MALDRPRQAPTGGNRAVTVIWCTRGSAVPHDNSVETWLFCVCRATGWGQPLASSPREFQPVKISTRDGSASSVSLHTLRTGTTCTHEPAGGSWSREAAPPPAPLRGSDARQRWREWMRGRSRGVDDFVNDCEHGCVRVIDAPVTCPAEPSRGVYGPIQRCLSLQGTRTATPHGLAFTSGAARPRRRTS